MLAHELRNPLAAVAAAVRLLGRDGGGRESAREVIGRQVKHLTRLIDDLMDVSRISRGKIRLRTERIDLAAALREAVEVVRPLVEKRGHELIAPAPPEGLWVEADPTRLEQIAVNLLTNAAKYTEPGGRLWLTAGREGGGVVFRVRDDGLGIPPEKLPEMFQLFAQGERSVDRSEGGLGIGLTIVKNLVEMHGGSVAASSDGPGRGSEFTVRLPAAAGPPATSAKPEPTPSIPGRTTRVLVVDDHVDGAGLTVALLRETGYDALAAHDGPSGLEAARAFRPDVVLLDIGLPGMDGYQVASALRREPGSEGLRIIAVSGYGEDQARRLSHEAGCDSHLVKPVDVDALLALLGGSGLASTTGRTEGGDTP